MTIDKVLVSKGEESTIPMVKYSGSPSQLQNYNALQDGPVASTLFRHNQVNIDGASRGNPKRSSYDFCIRSSTYDFIFAQSDTIPNTTNTEAETIAIRKAIAYGVAEGHTRCIIKTNSLLPYKILEAEWETPWQIHIIIEDIKEFINHRDT